MTDEEWRESDEGKASIERATAPIKQGGSDVKESEATKAWKETAEGKASIERATRQMPFAPASIRDIQEIQKKQAETGRIFTSPQTTPPSRRAPEKAQPKKQPTDELIRVFDDAGSTTLRRKFFNAARDAVIALRKKQGKNVTVQESPGQGTIINADRKPGQAATGACCISGECSVVTALACSDAGGNYLGNGTICDGVDCTHGACCAPDGTCTITTGAGCTGTYQGDGTVCDPNPCPSPGNGACCNDATCTISTLHDCLGAYQGDGTICSPDPCSDLTNGACCLPATPCFTTTQAACESGGGHFLGGECVSGRECVCIFSGDLPGGACLIGFRDHAPFYTCESVSCQDCCFDHVFSGVPSSCVDIAECGSCEQMVACDCGAGCIVTDLGSCWTNGCTFDCSTDTCL